MTTSSTETSWGTRTVDETFEAKLRAHNVSLALMNGSPYKLHLKIPGTPSALCGKTPGKKGAGSSHSNRTGWRLHLNYTSTLEGCERCLAAGHQLPTIESKP